MTCSCPSGPFVVVYGGPTTSYHTSSPTPWTLMSWQASQHMKLARAYWEEGDLDKARDLYASAMWYERKRTTGTCGACNRTIPHNPSH